MEKFKGSLGDPTWAFTTLSDEVPTEVWKQITSHGVTRPTEEKLVAACWTHGLLTKGERWAIVTERRIITIKSLRNIEENYFSDLTGVERGINRDIVLLAPGNKSKMFSTLMAFGLPNENLLDKLFVIISATLSDSKSRSSGVAVVVGAGSVAEHLEKLANLRDRGVLTDEEFKTQKTKLLNG